jgi:hypothetical protein
MSEALSSSVGTPAGREPVIVGGARTAIGRLLGSLAGFSGAELGGIAIKAALERSGVPARSRPGRPRWPRACPCPYRP